MSNFDEKVVDRIKRLEREVERLRVKESPGAWLDWTPTVWGWEAGYTCITRYCKVGKTVHCQIAITSGTSNSVEAAIGLPVPAANTSTVLRGTWGWGQDAGVQVNPAGGWVIDTTIHAIKFFKTSIDGAGWTNSGTKRVYCEFFYEAA